MPTCTLTARWIMPVAATPLANGLITIRDGLVEAVEPRGTRTADRDLGNVAILPGLVNAHTHLDLTSLRGKCPPTLDFTLWLRGVIQHRRSQTPTETAADIRAGLAESLASGTTLLGDISGQGWSWTALVDAPTRAVVFREVLGLPKERARGAWSDLMNWLGHHQATANCRPGVSPHAPYSVRSSIFFAAGTLGIPVAVHLAETKIELELLTRRKGPFKRFLEELGVWESEGLANSPEHVLQLLTGVVPVAVVHGNYLQSHAYIPPKGSIIYCPRTHAAFGHPPHPFRDFLRRGVRVAIGTDSLASNPDLDVLAEVRFLHARYPDVPGATLLRMATLSGAEALGWADETGSLAPGKSADLIVLPLANEETTDPHALVLESSECVSGLMFRGNWVKDVSPTR